MNQNQESIHEDSHWCVTEFNGLKSLKGVLIWRKHFSINNNYKYKTNINVKVE